MVRCGESLDPLLRRPLSIHRLAPSPSPTQLALLFSVVGRGTQWLAHRKEGEMLDLLGPLGNGFSIHAKSQNLLLVAGGMGIAPLVFLAERAIAEGRSVTLILGAETKAKLYPKDLLPAGVETIITTEDGSHGRKGMVTELLPDLAGHADQLFACGPASMYRAMMDLKELKGKSIQVSLEVRMGCGLGACLGCGMETKRGFKLVCKDGPVFELEDVILEKLYL